MFKYISLSNFSINKRFDLSTIESNWDPPKDLFKDGSSLKIAKEVWNSHDQDLKRSLACINFYINRAGSNLSDERLEVLESAKDRLRTWSHNFSLIEVVSADPGKDSRYSEVIGVNEISDGKDDSKKTYKDLVDEYKSDLIKDSINKKINDELILASSELYEDDSSGLDELGIIDSEDEIEEESSVDEDPDSELTESTEEVIDESQVDENEEGDEMSEEVVSKMIDLTDRITKLTEAVLGKVSDSTETPIEDEAVVESEEVEEETTEESTDDSEISNFTNRLRNIKI